MEFLDALLTRSVAALMMQGAVTLNRVAQDGMRVRAGAGCGSVRRQSQPNQLDIREASAQSNHGAPPG